MYYLQFSERIYSKCLSFLFHYLKISLTVLDLILRVAINVYRFYNDIYINIFMCVHFFGPNEYELSFLVPIEVFNKKLVLIGNL